MLCAPSHFEHTFQANYYCPCYNYKHMIATTAISIQPNHKKLSVNPLSAYPYIRLYYIHNNYLIKYPCYDMLSINQVTV